MRQIAVAPALLGDAAAKAAAALPGAVGIPKGCSRDAEALGRAVGGAEPDVVVLEKPARLRLLRKDIARLETRISELRNKAKSNG